MPRLHEDPDRFAEALSFTEAETTFPARLLEKDYYCTVLLQYLSGRVPRLVFKGGTCLAKVHANFFRLSEDLDFVISVAAESTRTERRKLISPIPVLRASDFAEFDVERAFRLVVEMADRLR